MNENVVKFDAVKIRILCYVLFVNDKKNIFLLIKMLNKCFRKVYN